MRVVTLWNHIRDLRYQASLAYELYTVTISQDLGTVFYTVFYVLRLLSKLRSQNVLTDFRTLFRALYHIDGLRSKGKITPDIKIDINTPSPRPCPSKSL